MKVKNLSINSLCHFCNKPKTCSFAINTLLDDDPDAVELPETCRCTTQLVNAAVAQVNLSEVYRQREQEMLWEIARQVAERDSIFFEPDASYHNWLCPFCNGGQTFHEHVRKEPFPHSSSCIVTKARALQEVMRHE